MFEKAVWHADRMTLGDVVFRLEHHRGGEPVDEEAFRFFKIKPLLDEYEAFFRGRALAARNVLELGMFDGGSLAFWFECLQPDKLVGVDWAARSDSAYFRRWAESRGVGERVKTYWGTDQADAAALRAIVAREFDGPLDLVFDDASHLYAPTRASFEALFPRLRTGGLYVIEDWSWAHWREFTPHPEWQRHDPPTALVVELVEATGTATGAIASLSMHPGFVVVERGERPLGDDFRLDDITYRRKHGTLMKRLAARVTSPRERAALRRLASRLRRPR